jgi:hemoglobin
VSTTGSSLYKRLGGYDAIAAVADDLLGRMAADPQLKVYSRGQSNDTKKRQRQLLVDFLCAAFGGPAIYTGRSLKVVHEGLKISQSEWDVFVKHALATLDRFGVSGREREEVVAAVASLKADTVGL